MCTTFFKTLGNGYRKDEISWHNLHGHSRSFILSLFDRPHDCTCDILLEFYCNCL